jgi:hypothetical protein
MNKMSILIAIMAMFSAASWSTTASAGECKGTLQQESGKLAILIPPEGYCLINPSQERKVLTTCVVGKFCRLTGRVDFCKESGECVEITRVTLAKRR